MATIFKTFLNDDVVSSRTLLNESIPITGTIVSGTYSDKNIQSFSHKMFQSVYDYPYLSSSANHIFDITMGMSSKSALYQATASNAVDQQKKINIYNQMAQVLAGYDLTGSILEFDADGNILAGGDKIREAVFLNFSRLLVKDEIKKGSFNLTIGTGSAIPSHPISNQLTISDTNAQNEFRVNSPAGEYGLLYTGSVTGSPVGLLYYQAGIAVITASLFTSCDMSGTSKTGNAAFTGSYIDSYASGVRNRIANIQFNNTTELNSTIYFCRINHNEFNYSANPTYLSGSKIRVKNTSTDEPVTYITSVGLYSADNELLAVAKVSEPLKKTPSNEMILRVRLDY